MSERTVMVLGLLVLCGFLILAPTCAAYKYQDCKRVGHETCYCLLQVGR